MDLSRGREKEAATAIAVRKVRRYSCSYHDRAAFMSTALLWCLQLTSQAGMLLQPGVAAALAFAILGPTVFNFSAMSYTSKKLKPSISSACAPSTRTPASVSASIA